MDNENFKPYLPGGLIQLRISKTKYTKDDLKKVNEYKKKMDRNFNSFAVETFIDVINKNDKEISIQLPKELTLEQIESLQDRKVREIIGNLVYSLITNQNMDYGIHTEGNKTNEKVCIEDVELEEVKEEKREIEDDDFISKNNILDDL